MSMPDNRFAGVHGPWRAILLAVLLAGAGGCGAAGSLPFSTDQADRADGPAGQEGGQVDRNAQKRDGPLHGDSIRDGGHASDLRPGLDGKKTADLKPAADGKVAADGKPAADGKVAADLKPGPDLVPAPDKNPALDLPSAPDTMPTTCAAAVGKPCTQGGTECGSAATCLLTTTTKGVCTCECTPDDPLTPGNEDTCPILLKNICAKITLASGSSKNYCFRKCVPQLGTNDCEGGMACSPRSPAYVGLVTQAVCLLYGCTTNAECPVMTSTPCTTSGSSCSPGQLCIPLSAVTTSGFCAMAGSCDTTSGLCGPHSKGLPTAKVGDLCADDRDCTNDMICMMEVDTATFLKKWNATCTSSTECCSGSCQGGLCTRALCTVDYRNGYCAVPECIFSSSLSHRACPAGSVCNYLYTGGLCQRICALTAAADCRNSTADRLGDYECRAWSNLTLGGTPITSQPVCDFGTQVPCDLFASSGLDCTYLGLSPNTTQMTCRDLSNQALGNPYEPIGYCLDNTASSSLLRSPMPQP